MTCRNCGDTIYKNTHGTWHSISGTLYCEHHRHYLTTKQHDFSLASKGTIAEPYTKQDTLKFIKKCLEKS